MKERQFRRLPTSTPPGEELTFSVPEGTSSEYLRALCSKSVLPLYVSMWVVILIVCLTATR